MARKMTVNNWQAIRGFGISMVIATTITVGCTSRILTPELGTLYTRTAKYQDPYRNPVIVIPGILGSKLVDPASGRIVWGAFGGESINPTTPDGARLLSLPMQENATLSQLKDEVHSAGALDRIRIEFAGLPITLNAYTRILTTLGAGGFRDDQLGEAGQIDYGDEHYTCFQFDYDWRRDNIENAQRLARFIVEKKAIVAQEIKKRFGVSHHDVKFDIVAHSMGGLITRYFLRYGDTDLPEDGSALEVTWAGAEHVQRVILVGTPNSGSLNAINQLVEGVRFSPVLPEFKAAIIGTMPSVYQLLPRTRHGQVVDRKNDQPIGDLFDPHLWEQLGWGLADPDQDRYLQMLLPDEDDSDSRRRIALDHQRKCMVRARMFTAALDRPAVTPQGLDLYLFAGDAKPTSAKLAVDQITGELEVAEYAPGDGTVLRTSAVLDERVGGHWQPRLNTPISWRGIHFIFADHLGLTADPAFSDNVLYLLLEDPR